MRGISCRSNDDCLKNPPLHPKISFDSRPTNPALLPLLFKGQSFVLPLYLSARNDFGQRNFSVDEKSSSRKNCPYCKGFSLRGFFCEAKQASLKSFAGVSQSAASSEMRVKSRSSRAAAPAPVTTANCGSSQTWVRISRFLAIYSGTKEIFATPPDRYTPF